MNIIKAKISQVAKNKDMLTLVGNFYMDICIDSD